MDVKKIMENNNIIETPVTETKPTNVAMLVAIIWAVLATVFALVLLNNTPYETYGGDAYTGIQNATMLAVRGIALLLLGSGALGIIVASPRGGKN